MVMVPPSDLKLPFQLLRVIIHYIREGLKLFSGLGPKPIAPPFSQHLGHLNSLFAEKSLGF